MYKALFRLLGGIDTSGGVLIYTITSIAFGMQFSWLFLFLTIAATHSPDADFVPYLLVKKRLKYRSHHIIGHHPTLLVPLAGLLGWALGEWYGATLAVSAICLHFFHDSMQPQGLHWFSPFTWQRISFLHLRPRVVPEHERIEFLESLEQRWKKNDGEILGRVPPLSRAELLFCTISWITLVAFTIIT